MSPVAVTAAPTANATSVPAERGREADERGGNRKAEPLERLEAAERRAPLVLGRPPDREEEERGVEERVARAEDRGAEVEPGRAVQRRGQPDPSGGEHDAGGRRPPRAYAIGEPPAEDAHRDEDRGVDEQDEARALHAELAGVERREDDERGEPEHLECDHRPGNRRVAAEERERRPRTRCLPASSRGG